VAGIESQGHVVEVKGSNKGSESPMESRRPGGGGVNSSPQFPVSGRSWRSETRPEKWEQRANVSLQESR